MAETSTINEVFTLFTKTREEATAPSYAHYGDAGADLYAAEGAVIAVGQRAVVDTGIAIALCNGYEAQIRSRSGLAAKHGIVVLNSPGTIDSGYRDSIKVILYNTGSEMYVVEVGQRIAQLVLAQYSRVYFFESNEFFPSGTPRGNGGLGSTGK